MRPIRVFAPLVALAVVFVLAAAASAARTRHYEGTGDRVKFTVELGRHRHTTDYELTFNAPCNAPNTEEGAAYGTDSTPGEKPLHVGRGGRFKMHRHFRNPWGTVWDIHFAGRFRKRTAKGTFWATSDTPAESGGGTIHCATGRVSWTARRG
jgi:hypothetical protein